MNDRSPDATPHDRPAQWWVIYERDGVRVTPIKQPGVIGPFTEADARAFAIQSQE